jgi:hypothetical protein
MIIEKDARRFIVKAIELDQEMKSLETMEKLKGRVVIRSPAYDNLRKKFIEICGKVNSVANIAGKGRDDLSIEILNTAEDVSRKVSNYKSRAVRKLADQIKLTLQNLRILLRKYSANIDNVDPQLKNNGDLADALLAFEKAWEKGKEFLLNPETCKMFISFSQLIEGLSEKYGDFKEKIESADADVFMIIPCIKILRSLDDGERIMFNTYYPEINNTNGQDLYSNLKAQYYKLKAKNDGYDIYNYLEQIILDLKSKEQGGILNVGKEETQSLLHEIKKAAIMLQRSKPSDWNALMETAMGII